jgi:hypothetical protein
VSIRAFILKDGHLDHVTTEAKLEKKIKQGWRHILTVKGFNQSVIYPLMNINIDKMEKKNG